MRNDLDEGGASDHLHYQRSFFDDRAVHPCPCRRCWSNGQGNQVARPRPGKQSHRLPGRRFHPVQDAGQSRIGLSRRRCSRVHSPPGWRCTVCFFLGIPSTPLRWRCHLEPGIAISPWCRRRPSVPSRPQTAIDPGRFGRVCDSENWSFRRRLVPGAHRATNGAGQLDKKVRQETTKTDSQARRNRARLHSRPTAGSL